jgi:hypothetical protein
MQSNHIFASKEINIRVQDTKECTLTGYDRGPRNESRSEGGIVKVERVERHGKLDGSTNKAVNYSRSADDELCEKLVGQTVEIIPIVLGVYSGFQIAL